MPSNRFVATGWRSECRWSIPSLSTGPGPLIRVAGITFEFWIFQTAGTNRLRSIHNRYADNASLRR